MYLVGRGLAALAPPIALPAALAVLQVIACLSGVVATLLMLRQHDPSPAEDAPPVPGEPAPTPYEALAQLERTLLARQKQRPEGSYTVELLDDSSLAGSKVKEEAGEVVKAVNGESEERVAEEGADVIYHLAVLLLSRCVSMAEVLQILNGRRAPAR